MTPDPLNATGRPRTDDIDVTDAARSAYLRALGELTRHHAHLLRARVGTVALQLDLARELLGGDAGADHERAREQVTKARANLREVVDALDAFFSLTRPAADEGVRTDLAALVRSIEAALAPVARDRMVELRVRVPTEPLFVDGGGALRDRLLVDALRSLASLPPGGRLEASVTGEGDRATVSIAALRPQTPVAAEIATSPAVSNDPRDDVSPLVLTVRTHHESR